YSKPGTATVQREALLHAVGQNPMHSEVDDIVRDTPAEMNYDTFLRIVNRPGGFANAVPKEEEVISALQAFDGDGNGIVAVMAVLYVLTRLGERMSDVEVDGLLT
ncbi:hypothetical protein C8J57DRAFT_1086597, partial [Mycena rebaudengoi]